MLIEYLPHDRNDDKIIGAIFEIPIEDATDECFITVNPMNDRAKCFYSMAGNFQLSKQQIKNRVEIKRIKEIYREIKEI